MNLSLFSVIEPVYEVTLTDLKNQNMHPQRYANTRETAAEKDIAGT